MRRIVISILFATVAGALTVGAAAALTVTTGGLGSGETPVASCDGEVDVSWDLVPNEPQLVAGVTVTGIDAVECAGQNIYVVVQGSTDEVSTVLATANEVVGTDSEVVLSFGEGNAVIAEQIDSVAVTIAG